MFILCYILREVASVSFLHLCGLWICCSHLVLLSFAHVSRFAFLHNQFYTFSSPCVLPMFLWLLYISTLMSRYLQNAGLFASKFLFSVLLSKNQKRALSIVSALFRKGFNLITLPRRRLLRRLCLCSCRLLLRRQHCHLP